jgi:hypothetical protein
MTRALLVAVGLTLTLPAALAGPRDDALRLAPPDAALVLVVQNAHDHFVALLESPFVKWFPTTQIGKQLASTTDLGSAKEAIAAVFRELKLDLTPEEVSADLLGGAVVFAFTPAPATDPDGERAVIIVRPRKVETLRTIVERLNAIQTANGEVKAVTRREHAGRGYYERQKAAGASEFYCFAGDAFAFSTSEADIRGLLDRSAAGAKAAAWADRLARLGAADAAAVLLVNPRTFDAELKATVEAAKGHERAVLARFQEVWSALDAGCVYLDLGRDLELGVTLRFRPDAVPPALRPYLTGPRTASALWVAVPENALFAVAGRITPAELIETIGSLAPAPDSNPVKVGIEKALGPVIGRDKLAAMLAAIGPDWAVWAEPPAAGAGPLPALLAAVRVQAAGPAADAPAAVAQMLDWVFLMARVGYNAGHADQIELREERHGGVVIKSLVNEKGFPPGFRPSFALKGGFLVVATSPEPIKAFRPPAGDAMPGGDVPIARFSAAATRAYLAANADGLSKLLAKAGAGKEEDVRGHLEQLAAVLELLDRADLLISGDDSGVRLRVKVTFAKPLKK